jgi:diguanylate cyclase (GGDEF)-like protein/PAS domain S-box-containing protein
MKTVCIIEDNLGDVRIIEEMLKSDPREDYTLICHNRLGEVEQDKRECAVDIVLLDLNLPDSTGIETFKRFHVRYSRYPVILLTGLQDEKIAIETLRNGAQDYIVKGEFDVGLLSRAIRYAIERKAAEEALRSSEERYALATRGANDGIWDWDIVEGRIYYSSRWKSILGYEEHEIPAEPEQWFSLAHPDDLYELKAKIKAHIDGGSNYFEHEYRMKHKDGAYLWMHSRGIAVYDRNGNAYRMAGSQTDITDRKSSEDKLMKSALYDGLTGLPNRSLLSERLQHLVDGADRHPVGFAVLFLDFDRFKLVNDNYGHDVGDQLLIQVADRVRSALRPTDTLARLGGDEFVGIAEDVSSPRDASIVADRILKMISDPFIIGEITLSMSMSIGIAMSGKQGNNPDELLRDADIAMYRAKSTGKARYELFDTTMGSQVKDRLDLENRLRTAIEENEFRVHYQPILSAESGRLFGFEALIRWYVADGKIISPDQFIPIAEETGLITSIDRWLIGDVCRQIREWNDHFDSENALNVAVNLSGRDFSTDDTVIHLFSKLKDFALDPRQIRVEVTESAIMENFETAASLLKILRDGGIYVELDDFGTGYSSLSYLHRFPMDGLKIDRSFVMKIAEDHYSKKIVQSISRLGKDLSLEITAEGVETSSQEKILQEFDCDFLQGYLYSKPVDSKAIPALVKKYGND